MNTCDTCRWYIPPENRWRIPGDPLPRYGVCDLTPSTNGQPDTPDSPMWAEDAESYHAWLNVRPTFGCNAWQPTSEDK